MAKAPAAALGSGLEVCPGNGDRGPKPDAGRIGRRRQFLKDGSAIRPRQNSQTVNGGEAHLGRSLVVLGDAPQFAVPRH